MTEFTYMNYTKSGVKILPCDSEYFTTLNLESET